MLTPALVLTLAVGAAEPIDNPDAIREAASLAAREERWCDARYFYSRLFERRPEIKWLYNAAEVGRVANDTVGALALYRDVKKRAPPSFPEMARVDATIAELQAALSRGEVGTACVDPAPKCGNGVIEGSEACDDADADDGDGCTAVCVLAAATSPPAVGTGANGTSTGSPPDGGGGGDGTGAVITPPPTEPAPGGGLSTGKIAGIAIGAGGVVAGVALTSYALYLDGELRRPGDEVDSETKSGYLAQGLPVVVGAGIGFAAAVGGAAFAFVAD